VRTKERQCDQALVGLLLPLCTLSLSLPCRLWMALVLAAVIGSQEWEAWHIASPQWDSHGVVLPLLPVWPVPSCVLCQRKLQPRALVWDTAMGLEVNGSLNTRKFSTMMFWVDSLQIFLFFIFLRY
jgi:hypothetical protein